VLGKENGERFLIMVMAALATSNLGVAFLIDGTANCTNKQGVLRL
jgi:hypothetical protein